MPKISDNDNENKDQTEINHDMANIQENMIKQQGHKE